METYIIWPFIVDLGKIRAECFSVDDQHIDKDEYLKAFESYVLLVSRISSTKRHGTYRKI